MTRREIEVKYNKLKDIVGNGWLNIKQGMVTDDTTMSISLAESIIDKGKFSTKSAADYFVKWMKSKPLDIGNTIRLSLLNYIKSGNLESKYDENSAGNGALMRVVPLCIYAKGDLEKLFDMAIKQAHITHNNKLSDKAIVNYCNVLSSLLKNGDKMQALSLASEFIINNKNFSFSRYKGENSGYVVDTYRSIMHFYFEGVSFEDTLIETVNNGGDADTIAALTGALSGATYGIKGIPKRWLKKLDPKIYNKIEEITEKLVSLPLIIENNN